MATLGVERGTRDGGEAGLRRAARCRSRRPRRHVPLQPPVAPPRRPSGLTHATRRVQLIVPLMPDDPTSVVRALREGPGAVCETCLGLLTGFSIDRLRHATDELVIRAAIVVSHGPCALCKAA